MLYCNECLLFLFHASENSTIHILAVMDKLEGSLLFISNHNTPSTAAL
jgi:hypothetical protein